MVSIFDEVLSWPKNIDINFYAPGAGGEFFTSLCAAAHFPTRKLLGLEAILETTMRRNEFVTFISPDYIHDMENFNISNVGKHIFFYSQFTTNIDERINYYRMVLAHYIINATLSMFHSNKKKEAEETLSKKRNEFKDTNIMLCTHWVNILKPSYDRTFSIPIFEKQKYWNIINLNPQTEKGKEFVLKFALKTKLSNTPNNINYYFNNKGFNNIKLKFPFMDYMIENDFNSIKDYIGNRYGPENIDYDFIDKSLIHYKKVRIDPYL